MWHTSKETYLTIQITYDLNWRFIPVKWRNAELAHLQQKAEKRGRIIIFSYKWIFSQMVHTVLPLFYFFYLSACSKWNDDWIVIFVKPSNPYLLGLMRCVRMITKLDTPEVSALESDSIRRESKRAKGNSVTWNKTLQNDKMPGLKVHRCSFVSTLNWESSKIV